MWTRDLGLISQIYAEEDFLKIAQAGEKSGSFWLPFMFAQLQRLTPFGYCAP